MMGEFIKDRGNIKWTAMMLPEHRDALYKMARSQEDVPPPSKSEEELGELAEKLARSMQYEEVVTIKYWKAKRHHELVGIVKIIDPYKKVILVDYSIREERDQRWILALHIVDVLE